MLALHYVPGGHGSPVCPKRSAPWNFGNFLRIQVLLGLAKFSHGLSRCPWWAVGAAESWRLKGALRFGPRSTTDASTFPPGPSHSDGVPHVSHVQIKVWHVFHVPSRLSTHETWTPRAALEHVCAHGIKKKASQAIPIIVSWDFDETTSWMPKMKKILCLHVCWVHTSSLCQQQSQRGKARVQQAGRRWGRRMRWPRSMWVREWLSEDRRQQLGHYSTFLTRELRTEDVNAFQNYLRMPPELFDEILEIVTPAIERQDTKFRPTT